MAQFINQRLNTADIILLLISTNSLADYTCYKLEIQRAMERHQADDSSSSGILTQFLSKIELKTTSTLIGAKRL